ncbi:DUF6153 family protein [Kitasatospora sp. McL0602]|uniref:DUF6153 family protein n=1 Tax=Kitasatospora sp. McL0602 TaxID=3439530 RepID=UPI003F8B3B56
MTRTAKGGGPTARLLLLLFGVLTGLFLMHGSPAAAATGCHRTAVDPGAMAPAGHAMPMADHGDGPQAAPAPGPGPGPGGHSHAGETCLATPGRDGLPLTTPGPSPYAAAAAPPHCPEPPAGTADGSRAPPSGGRAVLLQVCVSRT